MSLWNIGLRCWEVESHSRLLSKLNKMETESFPESTVSRRSRDWYDVTNNQTIRRRCKKNSLTAWLLVVNETLSDMATTKKALSSVKLLSAMSLWKKLRHGTAQLNAWSVCMSLRPLDERSLAKTFGWSGTSATSWQSRMNNNSDWWHWRKRKSKFPKSERSAIMYM